MSKFLRFLVLTVLINLTLCALSDKKGGQVLDRPFPFTVYILTSQRSDVFSPIKPELKKDDPKKVYMNITAYVDEGQENSLEQPSLDSESHEKTSNEKNHSQSETKLDSGKEDAARKKSNLLVEEISDVGRADLPHSGKSVTKTDRGVDGAGTLAEDWTSGSNKEASKQKTSAHNKYDGETQGSGEHTADSQKIVPNSKKKLSNPKTDASNDQKPISERINIASDKNLSENTETSSAKWPAKNTTACPVPATSWRYCMGVIYDNKTILTGGICVVRADGKYSYASVYADDNDPQTILQVADGRHLLDFRLIRLTEHQSVPGEIPTWQVEKRIFFKLYQMSNSSATGVVPTFGYTPKVAALKLLPLVQCSYIYNELMETYPHQTSTLPSYLPDTVACATKADQAVDFPGIGLVQPGLACPDSLGAPFILEDGTILGVLVASDCKLMDVAFFQTLGRGIPELEEDEEDDYEDEADEEEDVDDETEIHLNSFSEGGEMEHTTTNLQ